MSLTEERVDEIDEVTGVQTEHPDELVVDYGDGERRRWGMDDFRELAELVLAMHERDIRIAAAS